MHIQPEGWGDQVSLTPALTQPYIDTEYTVLITHPENGHVLVDVVLHLDQLLVALCRISHKSKCQLLVDRLFDRHARLVVLKSAPLRIDLHLTDPEKLLDPTAHRCIQRL